MMNGWQRLFVVFSCLVAVVGLLGFAATYPPERDRWYVFACDISSQVTREEAAQFLKEGVPRERFYSFADALETGKLPQLCVDELELVAKDGMHSRAVRAHLISAGVGAAIIGGMLLFVYALGWSLGWVWRGFFPGGIRRGK